MMSIHKEQGNNREVSLNAWKSALLLPVGSDAVNLCHTPDFKTTRINTHNIPVVSSVSICKASLQTTSNNFQIIKLSIQQTSSGKKNQ